MAIDPHLKNALLLSISKPGKQGDATASIAYSKSGARYAAGSIASDTNLLDIPSELCALVQAMHHTDFAVERIESIIENPIVSPLVLKIIADFESRTNTKISFEIFKNDGTSFFKTNSAKEALPFYAPPVSALSKIDNSSPQENLVQVDASTEIIPELKKYALLGLERGLGSTDTGSAYSAAIRTKDGKIYYGGQYSSLDKRLGLHAEMAVFVSAYMAGARDITHIGVVSTKYTDTPCEMCGLCRQFLFEMLTKTGSVAELISFSKDSDEFKRYTIDELLPHPWTSKKW